MKKLLGALFITASISPVLALPDYEPFADASGSGGTTYTPGANLVGQTDAQANSWFQAGSAVPTFTIASGSLSYPGYITSLGNSVSLSTNANIAARFAIGSSFNANNSSLYYSFILRVTDIGSTLGAGGGFIAGFNNTGAASQTTSPTVLGARVLIKNVGGGTGFQLGLSKASSNASDFQFGGSPTTFTTADTILIVGAYDINVLGTAGDDSSRMWINPNAADFGAALAPSATLTASTGADMITSGSIQSFLLYGRPNNLFPNGMQVDELRIGTSWADVTSLVVPEPGVATLAGFGLCALISAYRLRKR